MAVSYQGCGVVPRCIAQWGHVCRCTWYKLTIYKRNRKYFQKDYYDRLQQYDFQTCLQNTVAEITRRVDHFMREKKLRLLNSGSA